MTKEVRMTNVESSRQSVYVEMLLFGFRNSSFLRHWVFQYFPVQWSVFPEKNARKPNGVDSASD